MKIQHWGLWIDRKSHLTHPPMGGKFILRHIATEVSYLDLQPGGLGNMRYVTIFPLTTNEPAVYFTCKS